jgi:hypothetical protein
MASYFGMDAYSNSLLLVAALSALILLAGDIPSRFCLYAAVPLLAWKVFSFNYDDVVLVCAVICGVYAVPIFCKKLLTFVATFPLAHIFKFAVKILPKYVIDEDRFFDCDGATKDVAEKRRKALEDLSNSWKQKFANCREKATELRTATPDLPFTAGRCFPPFNKVMNSYLDLAMLLDKTEGVDALDIDGNHFMDISGSYGVNVCGYETYKGFWTRAGNKPERRGSF